MQPEVLRQSFEKEAVFCQLKQRLPHPPKHVQQVRHSIEECRTAALTHAALRQLVKMMTAALPHLHPGAWSTRL
jgi:hypothetical protein